MKRLLLLGAIVALAGLPAQQSRAGELDATAYIIHGINGTDIGFPEALPVDVFVSGVGCAITEFTYPTVTDPIALPAGKYDIEVRVSDGNCSGPLAASATIDLAVLENATIIANLNEEGSPAINKFTNDVRATEDYRGRLVVRHTAAAQPVQVNVFRGYYPLALWSIDNPGDRGRELRQGDYWVRIRDESRGFRGRILVDRLPLELPPDTAVFVHAVGSVKNATFTVIPLAIPVD
jgi:hypothetical protein